MWGIGVSLFDEESCGEIDGMLVTSNQGYQSNFDCNVNNNTCIDSVAGAPDPNDMPDLIENHMDYSSETCKNMFTLDQAMHMRGVLENERQDLISVAASIDYNELNAIVSYPNPSSDIFTFLNVPKNTSFFVYDSYGRLMTSKFQDEESTVLNSRDWSKGVYFVTFENGDSRIVKKIIKK